MQNYKYLHNNFFSVRENLLKKLNESHLASHCDYYIRLLQVGTYISLFLKLKLDGQASHVCITLDSNHNFKSINVFDKLKGTNATLFWQFFIL